MDEYLTLMEAAVALGISYPGLVARIRKGDIPSVKKGHAVFVHKDDIDSLKKKLVTRNGIPARKHMATSTR